MSERFAIGIPVEATVKSDGSSEVNYYVVASDEDMARELKRDLDDRLGVKSVEMSIEEYQRISFFGFSSLKWRMCDWEPEGPKKNWISEPPKDSRLN